LYANVWTVRSVPERERGRDEEGYWIEYGNESLSASEENAEFKGEKRLKGNLTEVRAAKKVNFHPKWGGFVPEVHE